MSRSIRRYKLHKSSLNDLKKDKKRKIKTEEREAFVRMDFDDDFVAETFKGCLGKRT